MIDSSVDWGRVLKHLSSGRVLAHPTETVYGLAARVDDGGVRALRRLKPRGPDRPFLLLLPDGEEFEEWTQRFHWTPAARRIADRFWPGPVTLILTALEAELPDGVRSPSGGVAMRRSPHPFVAELMERWKAPLLSTSANRPGEPAPHDPVAVHAAFEFEIRTGQVLLVDAGKLHRRKPSTLVDCSGDEPRVIREGEVTASDLVRQDVPHMESR